MTERVGELVSEALAASGASSPVGVPLTTVEVDDVFRVLFNRYKKMVRCKDLTPSALYNTLGPFLELEGLSLGGGVFMALSPEQLTRAHTASDAVEDDGADSSSADDPLPIVAGVSSSSLAASDSGLIYDLEMLEKAKAAAETAATARATMNTCRSERDASRARGLVYRAELNAVSAEVERLTKALADGEAELAALVADVDAKTKALDTAMEAVKAAAEAKRSAKGSKRRLRDQLKSLKALRAQGRDGSRLGSSGQEGDDDASSAAASSPGGSPAPSPTAASGAEGAGLTTTLALAPSPAKLREVESLLRSEKMAKAKVAELVTQRSSMRELPSFAADGGESQHRTLTTQLAQAKADAARAAIAVRTARAADPATWDAAVSVIRTRSARQIVEDAVDAVDREQQAIVQREQAILSELRMWSGDSGSSGGGDAGAIAAPSAPNTQMAMMVKPNEYEADGCMVQLSPEDPFRPNHALSAIRKAVNAPVTELFTSVDLEFQPEDDFEFDAFVDAVVGGASTETVPVRAPAVLPDLVDAVLSGAVSGTRLLPKTACGGTRVIDPDPEVVITNYKAERLYKLAPNTSVLRLCMSIAFRSRQAMALINGSPPLQNIYRVCSSFQCLDLMFKQGALPKERLDAAAKVARSEIASCINFDACDGVTNVCHWHERVDCPCPPPARLYCRCGILILIIAAAFKDGRWLESLLDQTGCGCWARM